MTTQGQSVFLWLHKASLCPYDDTGPVCVLMTTQGQSVSLWWHRASLCSYDYTRPICILMTTQGQSAASVQCVIVSCSLFILLGYWVLVNEQYFSEWKRRNCSRLCVWFCLQTFFPCKNVFFQTKLQMFELQNYILSNLHLQYHEKSNLQLCICTTFAAWYHRNLLGLANMVTSWGVECVGGAWASV